MVSKSKEKLVDLFMSTINTAHACELSEAMALRYKRELCSIHSHMIEHYNNLICSDKHGASEIKSVEIFIKELCAEISSPKTIDLREELLNGFDHFEDMMLIVTDRQDYGKRVVSAIAINTVTVSASVGTFLAAFPTLVSALLTTALGLGGLLLSHKKLTGRSETLKDTLRLITRESVKASQQNFGGHISYIINGSANAILDENMRHTFKDSKLSHESMAKEFERNTEFNKALSSWDVSSVTTMDGIFNGNTVTPNKKDEPSEPRKVANYFYAPEITRIDNIARNSLTIGHASRSEDFDILLTTELPVVRKLRVEYLLRVIPVNGLIGNFINKILNNDVLHSVGIPETGVIRDYEFTRTRLTLEYQAKRYF